MKPRMDAPKWWLRWRLSRAAALLEKDTPNKYQYSALAWFRARGRALEGARRPRLNEHRGVSTLA
jgi:hypothetical protein